EVVEPIARIALPEQNLSGRQRAFASMRGKPFRVHPRNGRGLQFVDLFARLANALDVERKLNGILDRIRPVAGSDGRDNGENIAVGCKHTQSDDRSRKCGAESERHGDPSEGLQHLVQLYWNEQFASSSLANPRPIPTGTGKISVSREVRRSEARKSSPSGLPFGATYSEQVLSGTGAAGEVRASHPAAF